MKITVNFDCTPEEARTFMGLPDVQPIQEAIMNELQNRMVENMRAFAPETTFANWLPGGMQNAEQFQKLFWGQFQAVFDQMAKATNTAITFNTPGSSNK